MAEPLSGLRVLLVLATSTGGVGQHVRSLSAGLAGRGAVVVVAGPRSTQQAFGFPHFEEVELGSRPSPLRDLRAGKALLRLAAGADVVHAHGLRAGAVAVLGCRSRPVVVTWHNAQLATGPAALLGHGLERLAARGAAVTLAASADLAATARARGGRDVRLAPVAAPALPVPRADRHDLRRALGAEDRPLLVAVGRLHPQKAYDVLLSALPALGDVVLAVAGDGPLRDQLEAASVGLPVRWLGVRSDVADLYAAADVVVTPSRWEARSLTVQEAMRLGRPVVATAVGGLPDLVDDGALLVPSGDPDALAAALRALLDDPQRAAALGERAATVAAGWPSEQDTLDQVGAVYAELLG